MTHIQTMLALAALQTIAAQDSKLSRATALKALDAIASIDQRDHIAAAARKALGVLESTSYVLPAFLEGTL